MSRADDHGGALSSEESQKKMEELQKDLMKLRTQSKSGAQMESPGRIRSLKKTIARLYTLQSIQDKGGRKNQ